MSHYRDINVAIIDAQLYLKYITEQYCSVNFHCLENDKSYTRVFSTINTIKQGFSFHDIDSALLINIR